MANGLRFKGTMEVLVDGSRLSAKLLVSRDGDLEYDEGALLRTLSDAGVTAGIDVDELVSAVQTFQRSKATSTEIVAAQGEPPQPPTGETWEWEDLPPLDESKKAQAAQVFRDAGPPEVYLVRVDRVKVQKKVKSKGGLFGAEHEEVQTVVENREVRQKVLVDPTAVRTHQVEKGVRLATIIPPRPGVPGLDVGGKPIAAPTTATPSFYMGSHLQRHKAEVLAAADGFLRVGRNWADLVSYRDHRWEVTYSPDKTSAYLTFEPGDPAAGPFVAEAVSQQLIQDGFNSRQGLGPFEIQGLVDEAIQTGNALRSYPLVTDRDGSFEISFNEDRSKAFLNLFKPLGRGAPFSLKDLGAKLREAQLKGFSFDSVKDALESFLKGPDTELRQWLLAEGQAPVRGKDLVFQVLTPWLAPDDLAAIKTSLLENARALQTLPDRDALPLDKVDRASVVHANQEFAVWQAPEEGQGTEGVDVSGKAIPPPRGNETPLTVLSNIKREGDKYLATIDGLLEVGEVDGTTTIRVRPHLDAVATVTRSDDNFSAWLTLVQGRGTGRRLDRALVDAALEAAQIRAGINEAQLVHALETAQVSGKVENCLIAEGLPPGNDFSRRLTFQQPQRQDAQGRRRSLIRAGEVAATYRPPAEGQVDGVDVLGNPIPSADMENRSLVVSADLEVETDPSGLQSIKALKSGEVVFDGESLTIVAQVAVASVGGKAGNVKFPGEVVVAGAVETGGYVMAGNLKVRGRVGGALLSSDHNIQVADGIHGEGKAVLRAKKHISVGFVERALVMAVGDVHVGKTALGCTFRVNGKIFQKTPGGGVQGGLTKVRLGLDVMNLGSPSGIPTVVSFGQDYLVEDQIQAEVKETDKLRDAIVQLDLLMKKLTAPGDREKLNGARQKKVLLMKMLDKRNLKLIFLRDKFDLHVASEIVIRESIFPGVSIESHGRLYEPSSRRTAVKIIFNEQTGHIQEIPLT